MVFPLIPVVTALLSGGIILPHSAGGLIVASAATGQYIAGTYMSTAAISTYLMGTAAVGVTTLGAGALTLSSAISAAASGAIGTAGWFGTTVGATGATGFLMRQGLLPATPIAIPIAVGVCGIVAVVSAVWLVGRRYASMRRGIRRSVKVEKEYNFSEREAKLIESLIRGSARKS